MMLSLLFLFIALIEPVNLQGVVKQLILKDSNKTCEGYLQVYYGNQWGYVGDTNWNENTEEVVCRSTHCGKPVENSTGVEFRPIDSKVWLNELDCKGSEKHLWECENPGWGISKYIPDRVKTIKCSRKVEISLDGYKCAGAVRFTTDESPTPGYFCDENWGTKEANFLCSSLDCGKSKEIPAHPWFGWKDFQKSKNMKIMCGTLEPDNLWQCANQESTSCQKPASVICTGFQRLQLKGNESNVCSGQLEKEEEGKWNPVKEESSPDVWCKQMHCGTSRDTHVTGEGINVTCSDEVKVVLKDKKSESKCYGEVHIEVNSTSQSVCGSQWTDKEAKMVCQETGCGEMLNQNSKSVFGGNGIMDFVTCSGSESSLWHCLAKRDTEPFGCNSNAYVVCSGSVDVRLVDGPGSCAGRVEVKYEGKWQRVNKNSWTDLNSDTVCRQLKCGNKRKTSGPEEKFSQGSGGFLPVAVKCQRGASEISECIKKDSVSSVGAKEAVGITCEKHKVVFLDGEESCSGRVGIEDDDKTYWLSGSNETWNDQLANTVCQQMNCGKALTMNSTSTAGLNMTVWQESYKCLPSSTSLFECENVTQPINHGDTIATVKCTGEFKVDLSQKCWGNVNICTGGKCGSVCSDTWTEEKSEMLCENLGCGRAVPHASTQSQGSSVALFKGLHTTKQTKYLSQCNFIKQSEGETTCEKTTAFVVCSGSVKTLIRATRDKCMGNVEVFSEGQYHPVCEDALSDQVTRDIICTEQGCGKSVKLIKSVGPKIQSSGISEIQCAADKKSLSECNIKPVRKTCTHAGLQCSGYRKMELQFDTACSGALFVYSEGKRSAVSTEGWTKTEKRRLCQDLKCGDFSLKGPKKLKVPTSDFWNSSFNCAGKENPQSIWNCENPSTASQKEQLFIQCEGRPNVTLSGKCGGEVKIDNIGVCDSNWDIKYSHLVCQEMGCSNAIASSSKKVPSSNTEYHHVQCEEYHSKLGQCKRFKAKCDGGLVSVHCVKNVTFNSTKKCGGQIQVNYRNQWENLCVVGSLLQKFKDQVCKKLECDGQNTSSHIPNKQQVLLKTPLQCTDAHEDVSYCITQGSCERQKPVEIICPGYEAELPKPPAPSTSIMPVMLGIGFFVLFVILAVVVFRIWVVIKARRAANAKYAARSLSQREVDFEGCDYEDLRRKTHETENFKQQGFGPEEIDAQSTSSLHYDDIDESAGETRPLTSQAIKASISGDSFIREDAGEQTRERVTYEVEDVAEDFGESYDDVDEVLPEASQANSDVHISPGTSPEGFPAPPSGLLEGDAEAGKDYLVPGQDW